MTIVNDQWSQPTWTLDVTRRTSTLLATGSTSGIVHATSSGETTWYHLALRIAQAMGGDPALVTPIASADHSRAAPQPPLSVIGHDKWVKFGMKPMRRWDTAFSEAVSSVLPAPA